MLFSYIYAHVYLPKISYNGPKIIACLYLNGPTLLVHDLAAMGEGLGEGLPGVVQLLVHRLAPQHLHSCPLNL
jgi:hypothetical protein